MAPTREPTSSSTVWTRSEKGLRLSIRVQPRSSRSRVAGLRGGALKVQVSAPPVGGAANEEVIVVLARWLALPRRTLLLVRGESARDKVVEVATAEPLSLAARIETLITEFVDKPKGGG